MMASMATAYQDFSKMNQEPTMRKCTPFCEKNKECPEHHELLVAIVNCTDMLGSLSNLDNLKECVEKYTKGGWSKDDDVPDAVTENRFPLIHWAAALGKCNALEWMLASGFNPVARSSGNGETVLHILARGERHKVEYCTQAIKSLIVAGADRSIRNNDGQTALDIALAGGTESIVEELIKVVETDESVLDNLSAAESTRELGYSGLMTPSPPLSLDGNSPSSAATIDNEDDDSIYPRIAHVQSVNIKVEPLDDNEDTDQLTGVSSFLQQIQQLQEEQASSSASSSDLASNSPLLKHLGEAGLLNDVSALLSRARNRDESNLRKIQTQAKEVDAQISTKLKEIERMKLEVSSLKLKRKRCDAEVDKLYKRLASCDSALKEIPGPHSSTSSSM